MCKLQQDNDSKRTDHNVKQDVEYNINTFNCRLQ